MKGTATEVGIEQGRERVTVCRERWGKDMFAVCVVARLLTLRLAIHCRIFLAKLVSAQFIKKSPVWYGPWRFIAVFIVVCHWSLSWANGIQFTILHHVSWISVLILFSHLLLHHPSDFFSSNNASCFTLLIVLDLITVIIFGEEYKLWSSLCSFLQSPVVCSKRWITLKPSVRKHTWKFRLCTVDAFGSESP